MESHTEKVERTGNFEKDGNLWIVEHAGLTACVHDLIGLQYLATLLANPNRRFSAIELRFACARKSRVRRKPCAAAGRPALSIAERARFSVSHAIRTAVDRIATCHTSLGLHLKATIHTGSFFSYDPDPDLRIAWRTGGAAPDGSRR